MKNYADYRANIKSGDLLAWSHKGWGSWRDFKIQMVRMFTRSEYSHVAIAWVVGGRVFVIEAVEPMSRIYPLSKLGNFYHVPMDAEWKPSTEEYALSHVGDDYKQLQALKAYFVSLGRNNTSECAALTIAIYDKEGIDVGDKATPSAVVLTAQEAGKELVYVTNN
jgi:hypothetical protein